MHVPETVGVLFHEGSGIEPAVERGNSKERWYLLEIAHSISFPL
jgi:hypothetical protein